MEYKIDPFSLELLVYNFPNFLKRRKGNHTCKHIYVDSSLQKYIGVYGLNNQLVIFPIFANEYIYIIETY